MISSSPLLTTTNGLAYSLRDLTMTPSSTHSSIFDLTFPTKALSILLYGCATGTSSIVLILCVPTAKPIL